MLQLPSWSLLASLVLLAGTITCPSPILSHTATEGRTHSQLLLSELYLCMLPAVLSGLCGSLKSRCFSAQQKMPENKRGQGKADPVKTCCQSLGCPDLHWLSVLTRTGTLWPALSKAEAPQDGEVTTNLRSCPCFSVQHSKKFPITLFLLFITIMTIFIINWPFQCLHNNEAFNGCFWSIQDSEHSWKQLNWKYSPWKQKGLSLPELYRLLLCHYTRSQTSCYPLLHFL